MPVDYLGVKMFVPVLLFALSAMSCYAAVKSSSANYILIYPFSTIETDLGGGCVRLPMCLRGLSMFRQRMNP
ncbi:MAG: hypothetical protein JSR89_01710 [Proteobacteria bacterium]|nr:hypothetical protein [Pseudomonadota bacterium]